MEFNMHAATSNRDRVLGAAWRKLDAQNTGFAEPGALVSSFQAEKHPWVVEGRLTRDAVTEDFLTNCQVSGPFCRRLLSSVVIVVSFPIVSHRTFTNHILHHE